MCLNSWVFATFTAIAAASVTSFAAPDGPKAPSDPLLSYLLEDDPLSRAQLLDAIRGRGLSPCVALRAYSHHGNSRVRAHAVEAMNEAGCSSFESYSDYLLDTSAFVLAYVVDAASRHTMEDAVPFLIGSLTDRRRMVTETESYSIGEAAHRALMKITCQSFHFDTRGTRDDQRNAVTRWRQWYLAKRGLTREEWVQEGIERGRDYAKRDSRPYRLEGLRLLALIGEPAVPALRELLARHPDDVHAEVVCQPEAPPLVTDTVPCFLRVRNASSRPLAFAPSSGGPVVSITRTDAPGKSTTADGPASASRPVSEILGRFADAVLDLAPGEVRQFDFEAGPVTSSGRYRVRARLVDIADGLTPAASIDGGASKRGSAAPRPAPSTPSIEAETILRFEQ